MKTLLPNTGVRSAAKGIPPVARTLTALFAIGLCVFPAHGQTPTPPADASAVSNDQPIALTPFTVTGDKVGRYQSTDATSGGRIAISLLDAPQSVSVITRELLEDIGGIRLEDSLQNTAGVTESTIPGAQDRISIRGFQTDGETVDNFKSYSQANLDPVFVERLEVVKGPNAILAPAGVPGGTINAVTRKPAFSGDFGSVMFEAGVFDAQRTEIDVNRVFGADKNFAFRLVGAYQDTKGFASNPKKTVAFMPMISFRSKQGTQVTLQFRYNDSVVQNYFGLPIDPSAGSSNGASLLSGVSRTLNTFDSDFRHEHRPEFLALVTTPLFQGASMRLAARYSDFGTEGLQDLQSVPTAQEGGAINPLTGYYTPGIVYGAKPTFTPSPASPLPTTFARSGTLQNDSWGYANVQNDYVYTFKNDFFSMTSLAGAAFNRSQVRDLTINTTKSSVNYAAFVPASGAYTLGAVSNNQNTNDYDEQVYLSQSVGFFKDRVTLNGGYSENNFDLETQDFRINQSYVVNLHAQLRSGSIVVKPTADTSLYYTHSETATPSGWPDSLNTAYQILFSGTQPLQTGSQNEYGARANLWGKRLFATVAYYDIAQQNYGIQNPGNLVSPAPIPPLPQLFSNRLAKGWEYELHANLNQQLSIVANYTSFTNRDPNDVPFRGTAEKAGAVMASYQFEKNSAFGGLALMAEVNYEAKRPGDAASGLTAASTANNPIPNQPTFWLPARTLVNIGGTYRFNSHWSFQLNVSNLFNTNYLAAGISRFVVVPGDPINAIGKVTYRF